MVLYREVQKKLYYKTLLISEFLLSSLKLKNSIIKEYIKQGRNLQIENLGTVAFEVLSITERADGSDLDLPKVLIGILNTEEIREYKLNLFSNVAIPESSSEPEDTVPPTSTPDIDLYLAE